MNIWPGGVPSKTELRSEAAAFLLTAIAESGKRPVFSSSPAMIMDRILHPRSVIMHKRYNGYAQPSSLKSGGCDFL